MIVLLRTLAIGFGLLCTLLASQLPEMAQQYRQRLGGAIDELKAIVSRFDADAAANAMSREDALEALAQSPDELVRRRGSDAGANIARLGALEEQRQEMSEAGPLARMIYFVGRADGALARATMRDFEPAVPATVESLLTAALGFIAGWGLVQLIAWPLRRWREMRMRRIVMR